MLSPLLRALATSTFSFSRHRSRTKTTVNKKTSLERNKDQQNKSIYTHTPSIANFLANIAMYCARVQVILYCIPTNVAAAHSRHHMTTSLQLSTPHSNSIHISLMTAISKKTAFHPQRISKSNYCAGEARSDREHWNFLSRPAHTICKPLFSTDVLHLPYISVSKQIVKTGPISVPSAALLKLMQDRNQHTYPYMRRKDIQDIIQRTEYLTY